MQVPFEWYVAFRYFRAKKRQGFLSIITAISTVGVAVGVMALIVVLAVMNGFQHDLRERILGVTAHIVVRPFQGGISGYREMVRELSSVEGVQTVSPFIYIQGLASTTGKAQGVVVRGIDTSEGMAAKVEQNVIMGKLSDIVTPSHTSPPSSPTMPGIILGTELARHLDLHLYDTVSILVPSGRLTPMGQVPRARLYRVVGLFQSGMYEYDQTLAYMSIEEAQRLLGASDQVMGIELWLDRPDEAASVAHVLQEKLGYTYWVRDWMQMNRNLFSALKLEKTVMFVILTLIVFVAAFNIVSSLIMLVLDKTKDIAIMKAMGATTASIRRIFMLIGVLIGVVGTILGLIGGFLLCAALKRYQFIELPKDIYYTSTLPVRVESFDVLCVCLAAVFISFVATIYPSSQAAQLDPVEALRYE